MAFTRPLPLPPFADRCLVPSSRLYCNVAAILETQSPPLPASRFRISATPRRVPFLIVNSRTTERRRVSARFASNDTRLLFAIPLNRTIVNSLVDWANRIPPLISPLFYPSNDRSFFFLFWREGRGNIFEYLKIRKLPFYRLFKSEMRYPSVKKVKKVCDEILLLCTLLTPFPSKESGIYLP